MFVRLTAAIIGVDRGEERTVILPLGAILLLPDELAGELIELGVAVPERSDRPAPAEREQR